ncbi:ferritin-like domain-containing protein [Miltoncostaea oceani]|uniref:ferritin-like domain-containing protein n=1 Tax=Miltoncostaea oceani TaxID=2843216 RepID=UPI001C3E826B|nr:ferritin-like domain-containing protein [Miltoncostaea oceani]
MSDPLDLVGKSIEEQHAGESASTRRQFVAGATATLGGLGLLAIPGVASATKGKHGRVRNDPQTILNVAATAEVLATIVNTIGWERGLGGDDVTQANIKAAAREELIHYQVLTSKGVGGRPVTKKIWVPDAVFASREGLLSTLEVGDQIFINAYLIGTIEFGNRGSGALAATTAEFMGAEAVHRALARQSLGKLGNDRVFMKFSQREEALDAPNVGQKGFTRIETAVAQLQAAGFGFGAEGSAPGSFYSFDEVSKRTPDDPAINTRVPVVS